MAIDDGILCGKSVSFDETTLHAIHTWLYSIIFDI